MTPETSSNNTPQDSIVEFLKSQIELMHTPTGDCYALIKISDRDELVPVKGKLFRQFVTKALYSITGKVPQQSKVKSIVFMLEIEALEGIEREVFVRIAKVNDVIYLDLANAANEQVKINKDGWKIIPAHLSPVYFYRPAKMQALPNPKINGDIGRLKEFLNLESEDHICLAAAWLLATMKPHGSCPVLCFQGEQGSGKSSAMRILRNVIDPSSPAITSMPNGEENILISALRSRILAFDNISSISDATSDVLCRLSTGGGFSKRTLFTDDDETCFNLMLPIMMNGITGLIGRQDLCDRAIFVNTIPIPPNKRRTEKKLSEAFKDAHPDILGGLCSAVVAALQDEGTVELPPLPRMADFAEWVIAAESALPFPKGSFLGAYERNRAEIINEAIESDPVASAVEKFIHHHHEWSGIATDLLQQLSFFTTEDIRRLAIWPKAANSLRRSLNRSVTFLREKGVEVLFKKSGNRTIKITLDPAKRTQPAVSVSVPATIGTYQE